MNKKADIELEKIIVLIIAIIVLIAVIVSVRGKLQEVLSSFMELIKQIFKY